MEHLGFCNVNSILKEKRTKFQRLVGKDQIEKVISQEKELR